MDQFKMQPFTRLDGVAVALRRDNVDTDQVIPARFLKVPRAEGLAKTYGQAETDLNIQKMQRVGGKIITVRADLLNLFDDPLLLGPVSTFGTLNFGQVQGTGGFARSLQFHVRVGW